MATFTSGEFALRRPPLSFRSHGRRSHIGWGTSSVVPIAVTRKDGVGIPEAASLRLFLNESGREYIA